MDLSLSFDAPARSLDMEWRWTGFTPADLLLREDMDQMLRYCGAIPREGIRYVRIHYLLNLVRAKNLGTSEPIYDWSLLEQGFDRLVENRLIPFVELMGNPSGFFNDYKDPVQAEAWKRLVRDLVLHFQNRYGAEEVRKWYFETWNEPDIGWWKQDTERFLIYVDACSEGLREADPALPFGGPGTCLNLSERLRAFLAHVDTGKNYFTGEPVKVDFLSIHEKGAWFCPHDLPVQPEKMVQLTRRIRSYIAENHPRLLDLPLMNNECDPMVGWSDLHTWHAIPFYPAIMTKTLIQHLETLVDEDGCRFTVLGNDHGFLGNWSQRTLLARFAQGDKPEAPFDFVKKSSLHWHTALSFLGEERFPVEGNKEPHTYALATRFKTPEKGYALLICRTENNPRFMREPQDIKLSAKGLEPAEYDLMQYRIDEQHGNPFAIYEEDYPTETVPEKFTPDSAFLEKMRQHAELTEWTEPTLSTVGTDGQTTLKLALPSPAVHLIVLVRRDRNTPPLPAVENIRASRYEGLTTKENILLTWFPPASRRLRDHCIEISQNGQDWTILPHPPLLDGSFVHQRDPVPSGLLYRVRPVDLNGAMADPSPAVRI